MWYPFEFCCDACIFHNFVEFGLWLLLNQNPKHPETADPLFSLFPSYFLFSFFPSLLYSSHIYPFSLIHNIPLTTTDFFSYLYFIIFIFIFSRENYVLGNLCNHTPRGKILPFGNLTFYFSNSMDFVKNKPPFIHCNSDIEGPSKNTLIHFDIINYSAKSCSS